LGSRHGSRDESLTAGRSRNGIRCMNSDDEEIPGIARRSRRLRFHAEFGARQGTGENEGGHTFKATASGADRHAVVGQRDIFSIIVALTNGLTTDIQKLSVLYAPFLLG